MIKLKCVFIDKPDNHSIKEFQNHLKNLHLGNPYRDRLDGNFLALETISCMQDFVWTLFKNNITLQLFLGKNFIQLIFVQGSIKMRENLILFSIIILC